MSNQFSNFLIDNLTEWLNAEINAGYRYRFHSDDSDNILSLIKALDERRTSTLVYENIELPYIEINNCKLVYVNDVEGSMNENFISNLRDAVSTPEEVFKGSALLVLHKSRLDTVLNSATNLAAYDKPFHAESVKDKIFKLLEGKPLSKVFSELMKMQTKIIKEEQQSAFGYKNLYRSIIEERVNYKELGLFNDPDLEKEFEPIKIQKRLNKNQELHDEIENTIINFPSELEDRLPKYSDEFIKKNVTVDDWEDVSYNKLIQEIEKNRGSSISFDSFDVKDSVLESRDESTSAAGKRTKNIIIFSDQTLITLFLKFKGDGLKTDQFKIMHNDDLKNSSTLTYMGVSRTLEVNLPFEQKPLYFTIKLDGKKASETFTFKILILKQDSFYLANIYNHFIVQANKQRLLLQVSEFDINFSDQVHRPHALLNDETVNINENPNISVENLYNTQDEVSFKITNGTDNLDFIIEGKKLEQVISIPLLYNKDRLDKLFHNGINAELNHGAKKAVLDHREFPLIGKRFIYIDIEYTMINDELYIKRDISHNISELESIDTDIFESYKNLLSYFREKKTVPSLCAWDDDLCDLVSKFVNSFQNYMSNIQTDTSLNKEQKQIFNIGKVIHEGQEYLSPFSPLILAYILHLRDMSNDESFKDIAEVTLDRLNPKGLFPYLYKGSDKYAYTRVLSHDALWLEFVPNEDNQFSYVSKLTTEKIIEFTKAFGTLFEFRHDAPLIINSINNGTNKEIFKGLVEYYKKSYKNKPKKIIVNLYDQEFHETDFDIFADLDLYEDIQNLYKIDKNSNAETIIDVMRTHITYSKHTLNEAQVYAHLSFFKNNEKVEIRPNKLELQQSGLVCSGLISGESAEEKGGYYYSGFGLRGINIENKKHLQVAKLYNAMQRSVCEAGVLYDEDEVISLMISENFKKLLEQSYQNSLWTVIIDPKVTLDFFDNEKDLILIHYSDQYSSSANYDAITVTAQHELYANVINKLNGLDTSSHNSKSIIREFNAFNGEWLIKMIADKQEISKREKRSVIAAYKYITSFVDIPEITWVPLSVAEMVRVAGNVGLSMSQSDFSRYNSNLNSDEKNKQVGPISDDILLAGFCKEGVVLYPVEVKSGLSDMMAKANKQAKSLKSFFYDFLFKDDTFKAKLLKGLFIRQVFMQVDKYELYEVFDKEYFEPLHKQREELLKGMYSLLELQDYSDGAVIFFNDSQTQFNSDFKIVEDILECRLPSSYQQEMLETSYVDLKVKVADGEFGTDKSFMLQSAKCTNLKDTSDTILESIDTSIVTPAEEKIEVELVEEVVDTLESPMEPMQIKFGTDERSQKDIIWFPTDTTQTKNTNTGIIGTMGTGKTQFTKSLVTQLVQKQDNNVTGSKIDMLIFDYKGDYIDDDFVKATNATVLKPFHLPYNPLALFGDQDLLPIHATNLFITTIAKAFGLGQVQKTKLDDLIMQAYEKYEIYPADEDSWIKTAPTMQDVWDIFSEDEKVPIDSLYAALHKIKKFQIFEPNPEKTKSLYDVIDGVTVIKLSGYDSDIQNLIVAITLDIFYSQMHIKGYSEEVGGFRQITKMILVDEADNFMSQNFESLKKILKEGRAFGVGTILSTQQLTHFKTSEDNYAEYIQSWIVHQVSTIKSQDVTSIFNISNKHEAEELMEQIRRLEKHFSIYVDGNKNMVKMHDLAFWELIQQKKDK